MPAYIVTANASSSLTGRMRGLLLGMFVREIDAVAAVNVARASASEIPDWHVSYAVIRDSEHVFDENSQTSDTFFEDLVAKWVLVLKAADPRVPTSDSGAPASDTHAVPQADGPPPLLEDDSSEDSESEPPALVSDSDSDSD